MRLPLVLVAMGSLLWQVAALQPRISRMTPDRGYRSGGFRIRLDGENLVFLPNQAQVMVGILPCTDVRVEAPWAALSCLAPACPGCNVENVVVNIGGQLSNTLPLVYTGICEGPQLLESKPRVKLPSMYSGAENCTICRLLVSGALSAVPDRVSYESLRVAMRDICGSPLVREFKMLDPACKHNMRDFFVPCAALLFAEQDQLLDALWSQWNALYDLGGLTEYACRQVGRCGGAAGPDPGEV